MCDNKLTQLIYKKKELTLIEMLIVATETNKTYVGGDICYNPNKGFYWRGSNTPYGGHFDASEFNNRNFTWVECPDENPIELADRECLLNLAKDLYNQLQAAESIGDCVYLIDTYATAFDTQIKKLTKGVD